MSNKSLNKCCLRKQRGIVLLLVLVLLVVLATLGYTLSSRLATQRHRDQYMIDYQAARYGCDSAIKYALATLEDINTPLLIERPNEPDFSDLFALSETEYQELLAQLENQYSSPNDVGRSFDKLSGGYDINGINDFNAVGGDSNSITDSNKPDSLTIRGPYGPPWPLIVAPIEFQIGSATVTIEIEDENAKYPLAWALLEDKNVRREALSGFETFCEWMDVNSMQIAELKEQLEEISEIKTFKLNFKPVEKKTTITKKRRSRRGRRRRTVTRQETKTVAPASIHTADFAKLFHSSLIDADVLAKPTIISEKRKESALRYMGMWASNKVNINTAPRQVLEAAFTFGGDGDKIAEEIIQRRRVEPFKDIDDLKKNLFKYSVSIEKCKEYITTTSNFFTIKVTAVSGVAKASAVIAIKKDAVTEDDENKNTKKIELIAVISS